MWQIRHKDCWLCPSFQKFSLHSILTDSQWASHWRQLQSLVSFHTSCCCSVTQSCPTLQPHGLWHTRLSCPSLSPGACSNTSIESVMPSNHLILCRPLLLLPPIPPSIRVFSNESTLCMRWPKYWSFSFSISPSKEHPGLISFRMDWWDLLAVLGTLKSLLQHHSSKASILQCSAFFIVQVSHPYTTTGKTIAFTICAFVGKVISQHISLIQSTVVPNPAFS